MLSVGDENKEMALAIFWRALKWQEGQMWPLMSVKAKLGTAHGTVQ